MATGNIDCPISERICSLQQLNLNLFNNSDVSDENDSQSHLTMSSSVPSNNDVISLRQSESAEIFANQLLNECTRQSSLDGNKNSEIRQSPIDSSKDNYPVIVDNNKNSLQPGHFEDHDSYAIFQTQNAMPEELFINVESDDEGVHSWRPNMSSNTLCSDFFVTPSFVNPNLVVCDDLNLNFELSLQDITDVLNETGSSSGLPNLPSTFSSRLPHLQLSNQTSDFQRLDTSSLLRAQVAGLNNVKYETINARRKIAELTEEIQKLTQKIDEKLIVQRTLDVEKLREENAQLRLECQCLCMEVDFYLKGKAPLGEIDENFYQRDSQLQRNTATSQDQASSATTTDSNSSDDVDDHIKWECNKCTFANHPAINSCEMCQTPRSFRHLPLPSSDSNETCFCHPQRNLS